MQTGKHSRQILLRGASLIALTGIGLFSACSAHTEAPTKTGANQSAPAARAENSAPQASANANHGAGANNAPQNAPSQSNSAYQIIAGRSIGRVQIGQRMAEVIQILCQPDAGDAAMGKALNTWYGKAAGEENGAGARRHQLNIYSAITGTERKDYPAVRQARVTSPVFKTPDDISTANNLAEIRAYYPHVKLVAYQSVGKDGRLDVYDDAEQGIAFEVEHGTNDAEPANARCTAIVVHLKGRGAADEYIPLHPDLKRVEP